MSPLELVDDRFEKLATELRASRPVASESLRASVAALDAVEPRQRWTLRAPSRRLVLGVAAAAVLGSFVAAGVTGLGGSSRKAADAGVHTTLAPTRKQTGSASAGSRVPVPTWGAAKTPYAPYSLATPARLQRFDASLRLRVKNVDGLSRATNRATTLTRALGGYVASVQYATSGGKRGGATLVLRVPVGNVQQALAALTSLGTILQQQTGILDVTKRVDREAQQIANLQRELKSASPTEAPAIRHRLQTLQVKHAHLLKSARLARITLSLTTPAHQAAAAPSRLNRTLDDAGSVLLRELEILLYALVVAGPLLLLGGAGIASARAARKRSDRRILERA
ncbi:MAG: hypothetical protein QOG06_1090 [Gaiellaceae bacterium]|nr:hypothetical protein [Gaiellaceae bacterium]